jgi:Bacterial capsule synthesis protein PGA_cap
MQHTKKYLKILIVFVILGMITGGAVSTKTTLARKGSSITLYTPVASPTVIHEPTPTQSLKTRILFTGDINLGRCIAERTIIKNGQTNNYNHPIEFVAEKLQAANITVSSLDASLSNESPPMPCPESMNFISPTRMVEGLQFAGFDVVSIATNHIKDCGEKGFNCDNKALLDTINTLRTAGIQPVGAGSTLTESRLPIVVEQNGIRFAFLGINQIDERVWASENTPGTAPLSKVYIDKIKDQIASAKQIADVVIVLPHWGVEYAAVPEDVQRVWARDFISAGASIVIGNHPHIIQPMEVFSDKLIFYSLGNFIFDQEQDFQRESVVVEVNFVGAEIESWKLHPVSIDYYTFQPHWADDTEVGHILARTKVK